MSQQTKPFCPQLAQFNACTMGYYFDGATIVSFNITFLKETSQCGSQPVHSVPSLEVGTSDPHSSPT